MNLEVPSKFKGIQNFAIMAAKTIFRPVSRKYDVEEHAYPVELDLFAAGLKGLNEGGDAPVGGANKKKRKCRSWRSEKWRQYGKLCQYSSDVLW